MGQSNQQRNEKQNTGSEQQILEPVCNDTCPECDTGRLVKSAGQEEFLCDECGLVIEEVNIDRGPEWRAFTHSERQSRSRVGAPTTQTRHDKGLTTRIGWKDQDVHGRSLSTKKRQQMQRLRTWHERSRTKDASERNLQFALSEIDRMASFLEIPRSVREVASVIYRRALSEDLIRGRSIEGVATGCLYAACRQEDIPRSLEEVTDVSHVERKEIGRAYRYIAQELSLTLAPVDPQRYVPRFCSNLGASDEVRSKAIEIIETTAKEGLLSGRSPTGFAAAAVYAASVLCNEKQPQTDIADVAQVSVVTIRNRYQEQMELIDCSQSVIEY